MFFQKFQISTYMIFIAYIVPDSEIYNTVLILGPYKISTCITDISDIVNKRLVKYCQYDKFPVLYRSSHLIAFFLAELLGLPNSLTSFIRGFSFWLFLHIQYGYQLSDICLLLTVKQCESRATADNYAKLGKKYFQFRPFITFASRKLFNEEYFYKYMSANNLLII